MIGWLAYSLPWVYNDVQNVRDRDVCTNKYSVHEHQSALIDFNQNLGRSSLAAMFFWCLHLEQKLWLCRGIAVSMVSMRQLRNDTD